MKAKGTPKSGVTVIITRSMSGTGYLAEPYGPNGAALRHQPDSEYPTIEAAAQKARNVFGTALAAVRFWSPDSGYRDIEP